MIQRMTGMARDSHGGFSLIEILIAITILGIGMVGILSLFPIAGSKIHNAKMEDRALKLAEEGIEKARSLDWTSISEENLPDEDYGTIANYPDFARSYSVMWAQKRDTGVIKNVKRVSVTVKFRVKMKSDASEVREKEISLVDHIGGAFKIR